ncbi:MAG: DNA-3-methyladenine glycosylase [Candidatus Bathyarchaeota archaeon]|jgi:DNA-3-methyladenine glycosylase|nr:DNA-3-methyladenine glycosylase [Candidatus Bathyarchaeota archaeon A05DMB-3]MDH7607082.1 DNA-3-methyladenine glycosylase [Candidatus Bathyarchaeota archaeon]
MKVLPRGFYERDPAAAARELLGKVLMRRLGSVVLSGKIVETEAYYGENDPASKAYKGRKTFNEVMFLDVGKAFIYMVHGNWLLNIVAHPKGGVGAVLIRALEPLQGIEIMKKHRAMAEIRALTSGPGKLSKALAITKELNGVDVTDVKNKLFIVEGDMASLEVCMSHRIGVKMDLPQELRFF